jgi:positive regulator of sigma E activity
MVFIQENIATIAVGVMILAALGFVVIRLHKRFRKKTPGCGCGCSG